LVRRDAPSSNCTCTSSSTSSGSLRKPPMRREGSGLSRRGGLQPLFPVRAGPGEAVVHGLRVDGSSGEGGGGAGAPLGNGATCVAAPADLLD